MKNDPANPDDPDPPSLLDIEVSDTQLHLRVDREALAGIARVALRAEGVDRASISIVLMDDAAIRVINREHLGHDWPTDVISFLLSEPDDPELSGELIVSAEMAKTTAFDSGVNPRDELALYVVHGLLHLLGHDDLVPEAREVMRRREGEILALAGCANTFAAAIEADRDVMQEAAS